ncbi:MAG TPA: toll/interleukin-1 receptor domain-containing protein [Thermoanaerobaculia bacterium]|jgi:hypothetical protein|nr:toll/interleukin-1 receptor domain-containing protein [Thermoanaerobaculia bacterium]
MEVTRAVLPYEFEESSYEKSSRAPPEPPISYGQLKKLYGEEAAIHGNKARRHPRCVHSSCKLPGIPNQEAPLSETFDIFLSHNSKDKPTVRQIGKALRERGFKVWLDEWELVPGRPWQEAVQ